MKEKILKVIKRDEGIQDFNEQKIFNAIKKANGRASEKISDETLNKVVKSTVSFIRNLKENPVNVEEIHKAVENSLMKYNCYEVARQYMSYRQKRDSKRFKKLPLIGIMESKLFAKNVVNQNANLDENSFGGRKGEMDSAFLKEHALNYYIKPKFAKNHINNRVYIHDLDSYILGMHNCFLRDTEFITSEGIRKFCNFKDGDSVEVLTKDGTFREATVRLYGKQQMQDVVFSRCGISKKVKCTPNHRWILHDGTVTTSLKVGDRLIALPEMTKPEIKTKRDAEMFTLGFIIGDGCDKAKDYIIARLCGHKMEYKYLFIKAGFHLYGREENGDETFIKKVSIQKQQFLTNQMWNILSLHDKQLLFQGYYAADGNQTQNSICTSDERVAQMIRDISALAGYHICNEKFEIHDTNYKVGAELYSFSFTRKHTSSNLWKVTSIKQCTGDFEAWCIEEPETHSFTLAGGMVTGNCLSVPMDYLLSHIIHTRQVDIRPAGNADTALQLVAVYFQLQSLQQFGGVSATHLDWTMVPFIRKSFMKHYLVAYLKSTDEFQKLDLPDMMFQDYRTEDGVWRNKLDDWVSEHKHEYLERLNLKLEDFYFDNKNLDKTFRQSAVLDTIQEVRQGVEGMLHNLNSLQSRSGNQLPFSSINYGTCTLPEGRILIRAILDTTIRGTGSGQTSIFPCQIFQLMEGVNTKEGDPNYDLFKQAIKSTSMRMYPNYANCDWSVDIAGFSKSQKVKENVLKSLDENTLKELSEMPIDLQHQLGFEFKKGTSEYTMNTKPQPYEVMSTMGCRTYNGYDVHFTEDACKANILACLENYKEGKPIEPWSGNQKDGRGNIAPSTIILPTLAMEAKKKVEKVGTGDVVEVFMGILDKAIEDCRDELLERFDWICSQSSASADFMYKNKTFFYHETDDFNKNGLYDVLKHGTFAIGQIGISECLQILIGCDQTEKKGMELAKRIEQLYNTRCKEYKEKYNVNFGVYYTPAESLCLTSFNKFVKKYGLIENVTAYKDSDGKLQPRGYFTNSIHVPVWKTVSPFEKIDIESQLTGYSNAGCITYVEIGDNAVNNLEALEQIVLYAKSKDIPYFALNVLFSDCTKCGYSGYMKDDEDCPVCGADHKTYINDYARITGYLSTKVQHFNIGKQMEKKDRFVHVNKIKDWVQSK